MLAEEQQYNERNAMSTPAYKESERKYLLHPNDIAVIPDKLLMSPQKTITQYYLNHATEPYELRLRSSELEGEANYVATLKKGCPPDRLEMETPVSAETYHLWREAATTEPITKKRRQLEFKAGHWALDSFATLGFSMLEAEGEVPLPGFGRDVTDDARFTNYQLSQANDAAQGHLPDSLRKPTQETDLSRIRSLIEYRRQRMARPLIIGIAGDTASGKTTIAKELARPYGDHATILSQDDYYRGVTKLKEMFGQDYEVNFDAPIALDSHLLASHLSDLQEEKPVERPTYSMVTSNPTGEYETIDPNRTPIIFVEGIHALDPVLRGWYDLSLFVNAPLATRVGRRLERDLAEGRSYKPEDNLRYLMEVAEPTYRPYARTQKAAAEIIYHT